jgi:hypothetical protein
MRPVKGRGRKLHSDSCRLRRVVPTVPLLGAAGQLLE